MIRKVTVYSKNEMFSAFEGLVNNVNGIFVKKKCE